MGEKITTIFNYAKISEVQMSIPGLLSHKDLALNGLNSTLFQFSCSKMQTIIGPIPWACMNLKNTLVLDTQQTLNVFWYLCLPEAECLSHFENFPKHLKTSYPSNLPCMCYLTYVYNGSYSSFYPPNHFTYRQEN